MRDASRTLLAFLVIPAAHLHDVVAGALKKVEGENAAREMIVRGERAEAIYQQTGST